ncbi:hypothetical protein [uncultured Piscinibacter sp.]|uniref:hypothetical protein n=1 Tax=uncultured Piscinibacter sp. TaxID=1131835 RepID=UPI00262F5559|nr:hypothetical protein [uncultured Piscinibacter sp.]
MAYRRMLSDMSQRHVTLAELCAHSGLARQQVTAFLGMLAGRGLVVERDVPRLAFSSPLRPLGEWLRRSLPARNGNTRRG